MDPRRILLLRLVAQHGSISAAAREAGWTQPALSQHLRTLENAVGMPLLIRSSTGIRLTEAGETLVAHADAIAAHLSAAEQQIADLGSLATGRLRIAAFPSAIAGLLPPVLAAVRRQIPHVDLHLIEAEPPQAIDVLRRDEVDVAIVFNYADRDRDHHGTRAAGAESAGAGESAHEFTWQPWLDDAIHLVVPAQPDARKALNLPLALSEVTLESCAPVPWIAGCERCQRHLVDVARACGFTPSIWHETDDTVSTQVLVAAGHGVALLPETALCTWQHPGVTALPLPELGRRAIGALTRPAVAGIPAVKFFLDTLARA